MWRTCRSCVSASLPFGGQSQTVLPREVSGFHLQTSRYLFLFILYLIEEFWDDVKFTLSLQHKALVVEWAPSISCIIFTHTHRWNQNDDVRRIRSKAQTTSSNWNKALSSPAFVRLSLRLFRPIWSLNIFELEPQSSTCLFSPSKTVRCLPQSNCTWCWQSNIYWTIQSTYTTYCNECETIL